MSLARLRLRAGLDRCDLAEVAGVSASTITLYEEGRLARPRAKTLKKIVESLRGALASAEVPIEEIPSHGELLGMILDGCKR